MKLSYSKDYTTEFGDMFKKEIKYPYKSNIDVLEIGVFEGRTANWLLSYDALNIKYIGVDNWPVFQGDRREGIRQLALRSIAPFKARAKILEVDGAEGIVSLQNSRFDVVYNDGDHSYQGTWLNTILAWELIKPYGYMIWDDINHPGYKGIKKAVNEFLEWKSQRRQLLVKRKCERFMVVQKQLTIP